MVSGTNVVKLRILAHFLYNMHNNISNICQLTCSQQNAAPLVR